MFAELYEVNSLRNSEFRMNCRFMLVLVFSGNYGIIKNIGQILPFFQMLSLIFKIPASFPRKSAFRKKLRKTFQKNVEEMRNCLKNSVRKRNFFEK